MKKLTKLSIFLALVLFLVCCFASCKKHAHTYSDSWSSDENHHWHSMTCKHKGISEKESHTWDTGKLTSGECGENAVVVFSCTVCGYQKEGEAAEHLYAEKEIIAPTCTAKGYTEFECLRCGSSYISDYTNEVGHKFDILNVIKEATCTEEGYVFRSCSFCGLEEETWIEAYGHEWDLDAIIVEPTCTEPGYIDAFCLNCEENCYVKIDPSGHKFGATVFTENTCGDQYLGHVVCDVCNETVYEFGHSYKVTTVNATCTQDGMDTFECIYCGYSYIEKIKATGHVTDNWTTSREPSCSEEGISSLICHICDEVVETAYLAKKDHSYNSAVVSDGIQYSCVNCSDRYIVKTEKSYKLSFVSNGGTEFTPIHVAEGEEFSLPIPKKAGFEFIGWYFDENCNNYCPDTYSFTSDSTLYASWTDATITANVDTNNIITDAPTDFKFTVKTDVLLTDENLAQYINITDANENAPRIYISASNGGEYTIASDEYENGMNYHISISDKLAFVESRGNEIWVITADENHSSVNFCDGVIFVDIQEVHNIYSIDDNTLLYLRYDRLNVGDIFVIYAESKENILYAASVELESMERTAYVYKIADPDISLIFEDFDAYYSGELSLEDVQFAENLEEVVEEAFVSSAAYARFEYSAVQFAATYSSNGCKYVKKGIEPKVSMTTKDKKIVFTCTATARFVRQDNNGKETGQEFAITFSTSITTGFTASLNAQSFSNFSLIVENATNVNSKFIASFKHEDHDKAEETVFKKIFEESKKNGKFDALDESSAAAGKSIKIGKAVIPVVPGVSLDVDLSIGLNIDVVGELGVSLQNIFNTKFGIKYKNGNVETIKGFESASTLSLYLMGKLEAYAPGEIKLSVTFLGCVHIYASVDFGPYFEVGGMFVASVSSGGGSNFVYGGYVELGVQINLKLGVSVTGYKIVTEWRRGPWGIKYPVFHIEETDLLDKEWTLYNLKEPTVTIGKKEAVLYFTDYREEVDKEVNCGEYIVLPNIVNENVVVQKLDEMSQFIKDADGCTYYLEGKYPGISLSENGFLKITSNQIDNPTVLVKVVYGNVHKYVTVNITQNHDKAYVSAIDPTCTEKGNTAYEGCTKCGMIFSGENKEIPPLNHDFVKQEDKEATCVDSGLVDYYICSRCDHMQYTYIPPLGHIEVIDAAVAATCTASGLTEGKHCSRCLEVIVAQQIIPKLEHIDSAWITDRQPTCTEKGSKHTECTVCHITLLVSDIPATGHTESEWITDLQPTCTEQGSKHKECTVCRDTLVTEAIDALGHDKVYHEAKEPTCIEIGWYAYETCNRCSYTTYVERRANGHTFSEWILDENNSGLDNCVWRPTYTRTCHCGETEHKTEAPFGHDISPWTVVTAPTQETTGELARGCVRQGGCGNRESITLPTLTEDNVANGTYTVVITEPTYEREGSEVYTYTVDGVSFTWTITLPMKIASQGLQFTLNADQASYSVSGIGTCTDTHIVIPDTYNDLPVTAISDKAFYKCKNIVRVEVSDAVISIGSSAFYECSALTIIIIPNSVSVIGSGAFLYCTLLESVDIPDNISFIDREVFANCSSLTSIVIPDGVKSIGRRAFSGCKMLTSIVIPESVTSMDKEVFAGCSSLASVSIPNKVESIGDYAFYECKSLTSIDIGEKATTIGEYAFYNCTSLTAVIIPDSVTSIGNYAFNNCQSLASVIIGGSVTSIGDRAFTSCSSLASVIIGGGVTGIGKWAFGGCISLISVVIPDSVTSIDEYAFYNCTALSSATIGGRANIIGANSFGHCKELTSIVIPDSVTSIGEGSFYGCTSLSSVIISNSITNIASSTFGNCSSLTSIVIPEGVTIVDICAFQGCGALRSIVIPNSVITIGERSFKECTSLTSVVIGDGVTNIDFGAFSYCQALASVVIGDSVTNIGNEAFYNCQSLASVIIGGSVTSIGDYAFRYCKSLTSVVIGDSVTGIGSYAFYGCTSLTDVYYTGSEEEWLTISIVSSGNDSLSNATIYYYSETAPEAGGNYWHYVDGEIKIW